MCINVSRVWAGYGREYYDLYMLCYVVYKDMHLSPTHGYDNLLMSLL